MQSDMTKVNQSLQQLEKKVIDIHFDADVSQLFKDIRDNVKKIEQSMNKIDFNVLSENLAQALQKGTKKATLSVDDYVSSMRKSLQILQSQYGKLFDPDDKELNKASSIKELANWKKNIEYLADIADDSGKSVQEFSKAWDLMKNGKSLQPLQQVKQVESSAENIKEILKSLGGLKLDSGIQDQISSLVKSMESLVDTAKDMRQALETISTSILLPSAIYESQINRTSSEIEHVSNQIKEENQKIRSAFMQREEIFKDADDFVAKVNAKTDAGKSTYEYQAIAKAAKYYKEPPTSGKALEKYNDGIKLLQEYLFLGGKIEDLHIKGLTEDSDVVSQAKAAVAVMQQELVLSTQQLSKLQEKKSLQESLLKQAKLMEKTNEPEASKPVKEEPVYDTSTASKKAKDAQDIIDILGLHNQDQWSVSIDDKGFVTIINHLNDISNAGMDVVQVFESAEDAITNFGTSAMKNMVTVRKDMDNIPDKAIENVKQAVLQEMKEIAERQKEVEQKKKELEKQQKDAESEKKKKFDTLDHINKQVEDLSLYSRYKKAQKDMSLWESAGKIFTDKDQLKQSYENLEKYVDAYRKYKQELQDWKNGGKIGDAPEFDTAPMIQEFNQLQIEIKKVSNTLTGLKKDFGGVVDSTKAISASNGMLKWLENNDRAAKEFGDQIKDLAARMKSVKLKSDYDNIQREYKNIISQATEKGLLGRSWLTSIKKTFSHISEIFGSYSVVDAVQDAGRKMVDNVKTVDASLTSLRMATGVAKSDAVELMKTYSDMGNNLRTLGTDVATASTEFMKQGESIETANKLAQDSIVLSKIGDLSADESTQYLTAALKGYKMQASEAMDVVDKISTVDLMSATNVGGLAEGMSKVANTANLAGIEMDTLLGYLAAIGEVTQQDMSSVGTALNTVFARMGNIKLGRLDDYKAETGEDLSNVETVLKGEGIALRDASGQFRDFGDVLDETASRWQSFSKVSQSAIAQAFAGKHDVCLNMQQCIGTA